MARALLTGVAALLLAFAAPAVARADDLPVTPAPITSAPITSAQMKADARAYYDAEMGAAYLFVGYGAVLGGVGGVSLTQSGDFAQGFGFSSLIAGGVTLLGGVGYGIAVKIRGDYYTGLADKDLAQYKREEEEHVGTTHSRFPFYLGYEVVQTLAGIGVAVYGVAAKDDLWKGIGLGAALGGIGLFVIDVPGAGRAASYHDEVRRFNPSVGLSVGGGNRPWGATLSQSF